MSGLRRQRNARRDPSPPIARAGRWPALRGALRLIRRAGMRDAAVAARRQSFWEFSRPVIALDVLWNLAFVASAAAVLARSFEEMPTVPLRVWIAGYAMQCVLHVACVLVECRCFRREDLLVPADDSPSFLTDIEQGGGSPAAFDADEEQTDEVNSMVKHVESANTVFSFVWWIIGFFWVSSGGQILTRDSPHLYWLCIVFMAFDVFFLVFCAALACIIGIAVCCCLPCIITVLYAVVDQDGASDDDICQLRKYKFRCVRYAKLSSEDPRICDSIISEIGTDPPCELSISAEDAECCICLSAYDDGVELQALPCSHHFHSACIEKWLHINATCPLCKSNITKNSAHNVEA